jgi:hypothetical protein
VGERIADPVKYENLFPGFAESLTFEKRFRDQKVGDDSSSRYNGHSSTAAATASAPKFTVGVGDSKKDDDYESHG